MIVVALLALAGAWLSRRSKQTASGAATSTATASSVSTSSTVTVGESVPLTVSSSVTVPTSWTTEASSRLDVPIDPSGSRLVRDEDGARQSVIDFLSSVKQRVLYLGDDQARAVLQAWAAPGVAAGVVDDALARVSQLRSALASPGGQVWWVVSPLAVRVEAFDSDRARVAVWSATVMASGAPTGTDATVTAPQVAYRTGTVDLEWVPTAGWSVWSVTDVAGPTPMAVPGVSPSGPEEFVGDLAGFELIKEHR